MPPKLTRDKAFKSLTEKITAAKTHREAQNIFNGSKNILALTNEDISKLQDLVCQKPMWVIGKRGGKLGRPIKT
jgi:hypothetical protein